MTLLKTPPRGKPVIDLNGPDGNAFVLLGSARGYLKQLGRSKEEREEVLGEMMSSGYKHLVETFDNYFGDYVDLILPHGGL